MPDYIEHYKKLDKSAYPSEWIIRAFLGKYKNYESPARNKENFEIDKNIFLNKKILDLGYGDGRNLVFFRDLGMLVYGIEPLNKVVTHSCKLFPWANLLKGENCNIPFKNNEFDYLVASHSIYYLSEGQTLLDSLKEALRVIKSSGKIFFTVPTSQNHYIKNAKKYSAHQWKIKDEFYNVRDGQIIETVDCKEDLRFILNKLPIKCYKIAFWQVDWWGTVESSFIISATKE